MAVLDQGLGRTHGSGRCGSRHAAGIICYRRGCLQNQEEIVARLHESFSSRVYFLAFREFRSKALAEDVTNETLLRVMQAVRESRLVSPEALPGFVAGTARNVIQEFRRKESRTTPLGDRDAPASHKEPVDHTVRRAIGLVLARMKPRERDLLRLYFYEELSKEEIGSQLGIDPERVRLVKSRALKSFREFYERLTKFGRE